MRTDLTKSWMERALPCKSDPDLFFPDHGANLNDISKKTLNQWAAAKLVCRRCPFTMECAAEGLGETDGVWGGLDPLERRTLRHANAVRIRALEGEEKQAYALKAYRFQKERSLGIREIGRLLGVGDGTVTYLIDWHKTWLTEQEELKAKILELPEPVVIKFKANFPDNPPANGDGWVRYGRRVVAGHYVGQTEDDAWFYFRLKLVGGEYSPCWIKADDAKMTREMPRNVIVRSGSHGSRIYGNHLSRARGAAEAG